MHITGKNRPTLIKFGMGELTYAYYIVLLASFKVYFYGKKPQKNDFWLKLLLCRQTNNFYKRLRKYAITNKMVNSHVLMLV